MIISTVNLNSELITCGVNMVTIEWAITAVTCVTSILKILTSLANNIIVVQAV